MSLSLGCFVKGFIKNLSEVLTMVGIFVAGSTGILLIFAVVHEVIGLVVGTCDNNAMCVLITCVVGTTIIAVIGYCIDGGITECRKSIIPECKKGAPK